MKETTDNHIGKRIKKIRTFNGMTQEELGAAINKTRSMVSHIERTGEVNHYTLVEIARVLKLSVEQLSNDEYKGSFIMSEPPLPDTLSSQQELIDQLKAEIIFLKDTIQNQWQLLFELSK